MADAEKPGREPAGSRQAELSRQASARTARLAAALKENLRKRKDQARKRISGDEKPSLDALSPQSSRPSHE